MMIRMLVLTVLAGFLAIGDRAVAEPAPASAPATNQVKTIFDYKSELTLSDDQEQRMRQILVNLNKELQVERAKLTILSYDLEELIRKEADLDSIKRALQQEAELRASIAYADLAAGRQINSTLTNDQLTRWRAIQASARQVASSGAVDTDKKDKKKK